MWQVLVQPVAGLVKTWFEGKQAKQKAKDEREIAALTNESNWDLVQAEGSKSSWKDEWLTILISIPLILAFFPDTVQYVEDGFAALEKTPEWYRYLVGVVFAASFGIKTVKDRIFK